MIVVGGGPRNSYLKYNKRLPEVIEKRTSELEEVFHQVFSNITDIQGKLEQQRGKASSALKRNLNHHLELMGKSAPVLLNFADVMKSFMVMIESVDEDGSGLITPYGRAEWQYSLSSERIEEEVTVVANTMKSAAITLENNVLNMDELFSSFHTMLHEVITESNLPWDDFASVWFEAQGKVESIIEETKIHIEKLIKEVEVFVEEIVRLDHMISHMNIVV